MESLQRGAPDLPPRGFCTRLLHVGSVENGRGGGNQAGGGRGAGLDGATFHPLLNELLCYIKKTN